MQPTFTVTTPAQLRQTLDRLSTTDFVALDTEFMRESTYFPKLCLIQAASTDFCAIIDPLALPDLAPFWQMLARHDCVKVLHAARQDYEVITQASPEETPPGPVFDTQIAAALLGYPAQIGYGALVSERLGIALAKDHTRADWSRRPLGEEQLRYAADDVRYLAPLYLDLCAALDAAGRLAWLQEETRELERPERHRIDPELAWQRLKGLERLQPEQRATAKLLAQWREHTAIRHDKPRGWILADEALREIAERLPAGTAQLEQIRSLPAGVIHRRGEEILALIARGREEAAQEAPAVMPQRPEPHLVARVAKLMGVARAQAQALHISPELLATRRDVERLVFSGRAGRLMNGWRREVIGERLVALAAEA